MPRVLVQRRKPGAALAPSALVGVDTWSLVESTVLDTGGIAPTVEEDFSEYTSTANMRTNPAGKFTAVLDGSSDGNETSNAAQISLDQTDGYGALTQCMLFSFPSINASDYSIGCNLALPDSYTEAWLEVVAKFSTDFTTDGPAAGNIDYKFLFFRCGSGRGNVMIGTNASHQYTIGYPGNEDGFEGGTAGTDWWDGQWHVLRWHMKTGASGTCRVLVDGVVKKDYGTVATTATSITGIALGRNMNKGTDHTMTIKLGRVRFWDTDPGTGW